MMIMLFRILSTLFCFLLFTLNSNASKEFQIYRMYQYDSLGSKFGSRSTYISSEAKTINSQSLSRKCVLVKLNDFTIEKYRYLVSQSASSIIVILPMSYNDTISRDNLVSMEGILSREEVKLPVYFMLESREIDEYYETLDSGDTTLSGSAVANLKDSILSDGYQFTVSSASSSPLNDFQMINIQARLTGLSDSKRGPTRTILITAHYDSIGMATSLSYGCDSNGSGVVALIELSRLLSYLYSNNRNIPYYNIIFLLTSGGKSNYYGTKKWLEEQMDLLSEKIDVDTISFAICLDSLAHPDTLYMHVSKPPKENTQAHDFLQIIEKISPQNNVSFSLNHKKINLANELIAWEHERFSLSKISAFTLSHYNNSKDYSRFTMTDTRDSIDDQVLFKNIKVIAESLGHFIYGLSNDIELFKDDLAISKEYISEWLNYICTTPRSTSLLNKNHPIINMFVNHFNTYVKDVVKLPIKLSPK